MRSTAALLALFAAHAMAGDPCESLLQAPPVNPLEAECYRYARTPAEAARREQQLVQWLENDQENPWLLATFGATLIELDPTRGRDPLKRALKLFAAAGSPAGEAFAALALARDAHRYRNVGEVQRLMKAAAPLVAAADDPILTAWQSYNEAGQLDFDGRFEEALTLMRGAVRAEYFSALTPVLRSKLLREAGDAALGSQLYPEALGYFAQRLENCGDHERCRVETKDGIATVMRLMSEEGLVTTDEAVAHTRRVYDLARAIGFPSGEILAACELGALTAAPESLEWNQRCIERATGASCVEFRLLSRMRYALGLAQVDPTQIPNSIRSVESLMRDQRRSANVLDPTELHGAMARLHQWAGDRAAAIVNLERAIQIRETLRDRESSAESRAGIVSRSAEYYYRLASLVGLDSAPADIPRAYATMEALRARTLVTLNALDAGVERPKTSADETALALVVQQIVSIQSQLADSRLADEERDFLLQGLDRLEVREQQLSARIAQADPAWARAHRPSIATLDEVRSQLGEDEALVMLQLPPASVSVSWALVSTVAGDQLLTLPAFEAGSTLSLYLGTLERRDEVPAAMGTAIEEGLLRPVLEAIPKSIRKLVIIPDGAASRLPLAALPDPQTGRPLIERFEISLAPSATSWVALRAPRQHQLSRAALGIGAVTWAANRSDFDATRAPLFVNQQLGLPSSREEVRSMVDTLGGESRAMFGSSASEAVLKRMDLSRYGVIHFATHALVNAAHSTRSAILLAPGDPREDGLLQPREIAKLDLEGKLVVLSACSSADGRDQRGEGPLSLARSFLGSGARAAIGTIWPVRDSEAVTLSEHFYAHLARGETVAASLARAQRELSSAGAPPAAWAGFILIGDGSVTLAPQSAPTTASSGGSMWTVILASGLAFAVVVWLRRITE